MQDTLKPVSAPSSKFSETKQMKTATKVAVLITTSFYLAVGCLGYSAFGDAAPINLLVVSGSETGFVNPYWLVNIANVFVMINMLGGYQVRHTRQA